MTIGAAVLLIAIGAILRYAVDVNTDVVDIPTVGLILMIAGGLGLALSLLYELIRSNRDDDSAGGGQPPMQGGSEDPTRQIRR